MTGTGSAFQSPCTAQLNVYDVSSGTPALLGLVNPSVANSGSFSAKLAEPLHEGQKIAVSETFTGTSGGTSPLSAGIDVVVPGDWGRVKAYFISGILISQNQQSFSQSSLFMGFTIDKSWMLPGYYHRTCAEKADCKTKGSKQKSTLERLAPNTRQLASKRGGPALTGDEGEDQAQGATPQSSATPSPGTTPTPSPSPTPTPSPGTTPTPSPSPTPTPSPSPTPSPIPSPTPRLGKGSWWRPGVNTFFDVRLTQIPVSACSSSGSSSSSNQSSPCTTPTASPSPSPAPSPTATPTNLETFLSSQKTARLAVGIYFPFTLTVWNYNRTPNALFVAPLAKIGFDTPAGSLNQTQPASASSGATTTNTGTVAAVNQANFYNFHTFGARIGHYALTSSSDKAPDLVSYVDVSFGPFSNLETLVVPVGTVVTPTTPLMTKRLYRVSIEGILKVPTTPLIIGLSANVGQEAVGTGGINIVQRAGDDLRFLFGVKFDVAKLLSKVTSLAP